MRKPLVAGNWKMHGSRHDVKILLEAIKSGANDLSAMDVVVFPTFVHLPLTETILTNTTVAFGAQNLYIGKSGAFTGEVAGPMLAEYGCRYVLVGHSERRSIFQEDLALLAEKFTTALESRLIPILCVGETLSQREHGQTEKIIAEQIESVITAVGIENFSQAVVAYEPVWAIGTGLTATPQQAQEVHAFIRQLITKYDQDVANQLQILYGGSVKADNAAGLFAMPDIDGALVGGASLDANSFLAICRVAATRLERMRA
jgi:triosephosphate isomerase